MTKTNAKKATMKVLSILLAVILVIPMSLLTNIVAAASTVIKTQDKANTLVEKGAIKGIDVSKWQGSINWTKVATDDHNIKFAFVRSTYGAEPDAFFVDNITGAHNNGIKAGAYHYARFKTTETMENEADAFIKQLKKVKVSYPVVLDVENHYNLSKSQLTSLCLEFIDKLEKEGYSVLIYSYQNFIDGHLDKNMLSNTKIWVANYKEHPSSIDHVVWQHTSSGKVSGISGKVDINIAYKDLSPVKPIVVDGPTSRRIIAYINDNVGADMDPDVLDMKKINYWLATGIQRDLIKYHNTELEETGVLTLNDVNTITQLSGGDANNKNIIAYIQAKLFYTGLYTQDVTGTFDAHTTEAVKAYQAAKGLPDTGRLDKNTLVKLFAVQA